MSAEVGGQPDPGGRSPTRACAAPQLSVCARIEAQSRSDPKGFVVASTEVEHYNGVDPAEVPSAAWGWSRINIRSWHAFGVFGVIFLVAMLRGNHVGHVENNYLIGFAVLTLAVLVRDWWGRRRGWLR
jgi:Protein of unknown function (DUF2631)